ncbi:MAG TPA: diadenylate cyclase [Flavobacteriales bacterium]|nr:diadenylate cyclase [Flavobacteriales bacterium]HIN42079.1 diadenylate cyclase [Flavobacteriales bacterium]HIO59999.1 diadenylate cyclase [Flavobacteriales bacterium]
MNFLLESWEAILPLIQFAARIFDVVLVGIIVLWLYRLTKGTSAIPVFMGLLTIYLIWKVVTFMGMPILGELLGQFIGVGILAIIIVFQQEIRNFLFSIGDRANIDKPKRWLEKLLSIRHEERAPLRIDEISTAVKKLASRKEGALIILQRSSDLTLHLQSSTKLNADILAPLIEATFHKDNSMHDGGMYIAIGRIRAVRCVLPVSQRNDLPAELGMRHRAALGLAEKTDALIIVVSEETGLISIAMDGELHRGLASEDLLEILEKELGPKDD